MPADYRVVIFTTLVMSVGANITKENMAYIRSIIPSLRMLGPGLAQFRAAVQHYQPGVRRDFKEPRFVMDSSLHHFSVLTASPAATTVERLRQILATKKWYFQGVASVRTLGIVTRNASEPTGRSTRRSVNHENPRSLSTLSKSRQTLL